MVFTIKRKQLWKNVNLYTIRLYDGTFFVDEVVGFEPEELNKMICNIYFLGDRVMP